MPVSLHLFTINLRSKSWDRCIHFNVVKCLLPHSFHCGSARCMVSFYLTLQPVDIFLMLISRYQAGSKIVPHIGLHSFASVHPGYVRDSLGPFYLLEYHIFSCEIYTRGIAKFLWIWYFLSRFEDKEFPSRCGQKQTTAHYWCNVLEFHCIC